jgi:hypothetical protein
MLFRRSKSRPDAPLVLRRAMILAYQLRRGLAQPPSSTLQQLAAPELDRLRAEIGRRNKVENDEIRKSDLWKLMTPREQAFMSADVDRVTERQFLDAMWLAESLHCLLWSLGRVDSIPPHDVQASPEETWKALPQRSLADNAPKAALRDEAEIERGRSLAELWNWRSRTRCLQEQGHFKPGAEVAPGMSIEQVINQAAELAAKKGDLPAPIGGDFPAFGKLYREISAEQWSEATSIAMERHKALNWLSGLAPGNGWDETPLET